MTVTISLPVDVVIMVLHICPEVGPAAPGPLLGASVGSEPLDTGALAVGLAAVDGCGFCDNPQGTEAVVVTVILPLKEVITVEHPLTGVDEANADDTGLLETSTPVPEPLDAGPL